MCLYIFVNIICDGNKITCDLTYNNSKKTHTKDADICHFDGIRHFDSVHICTVSRDILFSVDALLCYNNYNTSKGNQMPYNKKPRYMYRQE